MPRALWKGAISFGLVHVPVELFPAEKRSAQLDLTMLDKRDFAPVGYKRVNKATGAEVPWREVVKGYEYEKGEYVVLSDEDFRRANVEASRTIDIVAFVDAADIPPQHFETPYYLAPAKRGEKAYGLLRDAMEKAGKAGVATVVIRTRQHLAALLPQNGHLLLNTLRFAGELKEPAEQKGGKASAREMSMALRLIEDMSEAWKPGRYKDTFHEDLMKRIEEKVKKGQTAEITPPTKEKGRQAEVVDLMSLLKKSIDRKPARKAARKRRAA